jgi:hypothetical protein
MTSQPGSPSHIETTELLVRLYVFLTQYLDRCINAEAHESYPESDLRTHLHETRSRLAEILSVNRVVKTKVEPECDRVLHLGAACRESGGKTIDVALLKAEQATCGIKRSS